MDMWVPRASRAQWRLGVLSFDIALLTAAEQKRPAWAKKRISAFQQARSSGFTVCFAWTPSFSQAPAHRPQRRREGECRRESCEETVVRSPASRVRILPVLSYPVVPFDSI